MKKLIPLVVLLGFICFAVQPAFAHGKQQSVVIPEDEDLNPLEAGVGVDATIYKFKNKKFLDSINVEVKKDFVEMERASLYVVLKCDLTPKEKTVTPKPETK